MVMIGMSGSFLAVSVSEKRRASKGIRLNYILNDLACNITHLSLPLRREIFIHEKRNQVNTDKHVFMVCK